MYTIYRLQHKVENIGPYCSCYIDDMSWYYDFDAYSAGRNSHPNKWEDNLDHYGKEYLFGFSSLNSLLVWFGHFLPLLIKEADFIIAEYQVEEYHEGESKKQIVFIPTEFKDITQSFFNSL